MDGYCCSVCIELVGGKVVGIIVERGVIFEVNLEGTSSKMPSSVAAMIRSPANRHTKARSAWMCDPPLLTRTLARKTRNMATVFGCIEIQSISGSRCSLTQAVFAPSSACPWLTRARGLPSRSMSTRSLSRPMVSSDMDSIIASVDSRYLKSSSVKPGVLEGRCFRFGITGSQREGMTSVMSSASMLSSLASKRAFYKVLKDVEKTKGCRQSSA